MPSTTLQGYGKNKVFRLNTAIELIDQLNIHYLYLYFLEISIKYIWQKKEKKNLEAEEALKVH